MQSIAIIMIVLVSFFSGAFTLLGYMLWRMMRNDDWDDSNITNALRLLSHVVLHPKDFGKMYYLTAKEAMAIEVADLVPGKPITARKPFWYVDKDELSEVVKTRP